MHEHRRFRILVLDGVLRLCYLLFMAKQLKTVRIKPNDLKELARIAKKEDETVSSLIQRAVREFLERMARKAA